MRSPPACLLTPLPRCQAAERMGIWWYAATVLSPGAKAAKSAPAAGVVEGVDDGAAGRARTGAARVVSRAARPRVGRTRLGARRCHPGAGWARRGAARRAP